MMGIVDLMGSTRWDESQIVARMEGLIREHCTATEELILHRKMIGAAFGMYELSAGEQAEIAAYAQVCGAAQLAGRQARLDAALLDRVLAAEAGTQELAEDDHDGHQLYGARALARAVVDLTEPEIPPEAPVDTEGGEA